MHMECKTSYKKLELYFERKRSYFEALIWNTIYSRYEFSWYQLNVKPQNFKKKILWNRNMFFKTNERSFFCE
jgi:hypothetical protein